MGKTNTVANSHQLIAKMRAWARSFGFQQLGVSDINLAKAEAELAAWLASGFHGNMHYMARHGTKRSRPDELVPNTIRVISVRMDYFSKTPQSSWQVINNDQQGFISRYALGRDYHKLMRRRLQRLADKIKQEVAPMNSRVFCDSAPVMEKAIAEKAGIGWVGKHSILLNKDHGSYFFLGEIYTDLALPLTDPIAEHCGTCTACIDICPTKAIVAPYKVDARRCISYLTIELRDSIPIEFRPMMGNRIYGCDDCQLICPWNKFAQETVESDYLPRHGLDAPQLVDLFSWTEQMFLKKLEGSPIRRIGYECWLRNISVALGNATSSDAVIAALKSRLDHPSKLVREHVHWAIAQHS